MFQYMITITQDDFQKLLIVAKKQNEVLSITDINFFLFLATNAEIKDFESYLEKENYDKAFKILKSVAGND